MDVGCGSGILSIVSAKLGAGTVKGTDVDAACMEAVRENMKANGLFGREKDFYVGNLIEDNALKEQIGRECYDIVVANILADIIIPLTPVIPERMKQGGVYITSGIIDFKEDSVKRAMEAEGMEILEITRQGEWVCITAGKN